LQTFCRKPDPFCGLNFKFIGDEGDRMTEFAWEGGRERKDVGARVFEAEDFGGEGVGIFGKT
jgi:hypothetical protein